WNDIGFNNPDIISPNINQLAQTGLILNHSYVQPMCSPSRSAFMTGWYPFRLGTQHNVIFSQQNVCLPLDKTLLPQVLKQNGYKTHAIGKRLRLCYNAPAAPGVINQSRYQAGT
ncbi:arylsulfatase b-like, partial [Plakobranchus ocellatus]